MQANDFKVQLEPLAALCKRRGFIFQGSEIYGGFNGFWDFGPMVTFASTGSSWLKGMRLIWAGKKCRSSQENDNFLVEPIEEIPLILWLLSFISTILL